MASGTADRLAWRIVQDQIASCNCDWNCPCQFGMPKPTHGGCEAVEAFVIQEGYYHDTDLAGVRWAWLLHWPGAISEGNGHRMLVVDPSTTDAQREAMIALTNGTEGHPFFEIFASMTPHVHDPAVAEINVTYDAKERTAHLVIEGLAENTIEPILTPQGPKRVRIDMPDGFEFTISEIANSTAWSVDGPGPLAMRHEATYSQLSRMEWASDGSTR